MKKILLALIFTAIFNPAYAATDKEELILKMDTVSKELLPLSIAQPNFTCINFVTNAYGDMSHAPIEYKYGSVTKVLSYLHEASNNLSKAIDDKSCSKRNELIVEKVEIDNLATKIG